MRKDALVNSLYNYPLNMTSSPLRKNWRSEEFHLYQTISNLPGRKHWNITGAWLFPINFPFHLQEQVLLLQQLIGGYSKSPLHQKNIPC